jgi:2'-5' RNA ligase
LFLGNTDEEKVDIISSGLKEVCNGFGHFEMVIKGIGLFKNMNHPRVIWAGIEPSGKLELLNLNIVDRLRSLGFNIGDYNFKPHLTLGRIKSIVQKNVLKMLVDKYGTTEIQNLTVENIILYESILLPSGPVYKPIDIFSLK